MTPSPTKADIISGGRLTANEGDTTSVEGVGREGEMWGALSLYLRFDS